MHLTTACTPTAVGAAFEKSAAESESEDEDQGSSGVGRGHEVATAVEGSSKRRSVFSPAKATLSKKTKKDAVLSTLASSISTLVIHTVSKPSEQERTEITSVQKALASMRHDILQVSGRVVEMEAKFNAATDNKFRRRDESGTRKYYMTTHTNESGYMKLNAH
ncbi:hypothetical protein GN958_ATG16896 [Phytophthora infestans]|uniref:Uncharacterized protein n=1 Tax=Phytophthora infestans TaxID=4787 RepID=A0A8S9TZX9_PHYIN|nr:hypothetical protein GN958_ATG16896 [Phytophthora infestans]